MVATCFLKSFSLIIAFFALSLTASETCEETNIPIEHYSEELPVIVLNYDDLVNKRNLSQSISEAYGPSGLGILLVKNPPNLPTLRRNVLLTSYKLAHLPEDELKQLEDPDSFYSVGWSHGKEKLAKGQPDYSKGSFYGNPIIDGDVGSVLNISEETVKENCPFYCANVWPDSTSLPELRDNFMNAGQLLYNVGKLISYQLDQFVFTQRDYYDPNTMQNAISTKIPKGRLLYYYSKNEMENMGYLSEDENSPRDDDWCGWHNDHSSLTGLILGMYFDNNGDIVDITNKNSENGLYITTRQNKKYHLKFNEYEKNTYIAYQIGETSQILSGGSLMATPHSVKGAKLDKYKNLGRASFALFMQPNHTHHMNAPSGVDLELVQFDRFLPPNVPKLAKRWDNRTDDTFGKFSERTIMGYYIS